MICISDTQSLMCIKNHFYITKLVKLRTHDRKYLLSDFRFTYQEDLQKRWKKKKKRIDLIELNELVHILVISNTKSEGDFGWKLVGFFNIKLKGPLNKFSIFLM